MSKLKFFLLWIIIAFSWQTQGQLFDNSKDYDIFRNYTKWGIQVEGLLYYPADFTPQVGGYSFKSQLGIGYKFGLIYNLNFTNHFGFRVGALAGKVPVINTYFVLDKDKIGSSEDYFHKKGASYSPFNFSIPLLFEYRNFTFERFILNIDAGIQVERTTAAITTDSYKNYYVASLQNTGNWDFDLVLRAGWYFQFKRLMTQTNIVYKHRFVNQYEGVYLIDNLHETPVQSGKIVQKGDYIGLSIDFYFHRRTREVDMGCRANTQSKQVKKRQRAQEKAKAKIRKRQEKIKKKALNRKRKKHWWQFWK